jgi:tripeptide aminopeptidase
MAPFTSSLAEQLAPDLLDRFLRYVRIATQSDRDSGTRPSTPGQLDLSRLLVDELRALGLEDAELLDGGHVMATLPASGWTAPGEPPVVGLIAHVDTSPDAPGDGVEPIVHRGYDGGVIELPRGGTVLDPARMPELDAARGHDLISSSGDTLLGADDKAGVAEIMAAVAHLAAHPELPRPTLRIGFTTDEEIGQGGIHFDVERFGARCAYTIDGSDLGELQDETFTAAEAVVTITGVDVHPGFATGKLVHAGRLAAQVLAALPSDRLTPETTSGREGFIHPVEISGGAGEARIVLIVRDFEDDLLAEHVALLRRTAEEVVGREPRATLELTVRAQYPNMRDHLAATPEVVELAERALRAEGIEPVRTPIRGGTDGSLLSARGLPTPNLFTGGHEYHSVREWASLHEMAASAATLVRLAEAWATQPAG